MKTLIGLWVALSFVVVGTTGFSAETEKLPGPILSGMGNLEFPITTSSPKAQRYFNQGLILCYAFNHKEAIRSFRSSAAVDPNCAMAFWGISYAYGPHVNKPMSEEDNAKAWAALQQAVAVTNNSTLKEQALIRALSARYEKTFREDRADLDKAYAAAMRQVVRQFPDDLDIQTLFAEALMDTMPWDYWLKDRSPKPETEEALKALKFVISRDPHHPGANHFYIHAVEAGPTPEAGLASADRLLGFAPGAGHLVHMPSHIYMRVGQYDNAVVANQRAVKADKQYLKQTRAQGFYPGVYYPHNIHFLWWALLFEGRSKEAQQTAEQAAVYAGDNFCSPSQVLEAPRFRHLPWLTYMRFGKWDDILKVPAPPATNDFLIDRSIWHFTRGLAFAAKQEVQAADAEHAALAGLARSEAAKRLDAPTLPVSSILAVADQWLAARVAEIKGDEAGMMKHFAEAIRIEDEMPYMEPAYWPINVRPAYGGALLRVNQPKLAEKVFREDLQKMPRNAWGLYGLEQALRAQGRSDAAAVVARQWRETWKNADTPLRLSSF